MTVYVKCVFRFNVHQTLKTQVDKIQKLFQPIFIMALWRRGFSDVTFWLPLMF